ncbi:phosphotransferase family protein [Streptomyces sp. enrichment culture]|uniref:phosphotransferase family protein n=1 Tax=Streptomyces sp. enrichment culture TaxID=1795815 RepID=UPI003F542924
MSSAADVDGRRTVGEACAAVGLRGGDAEPVRLAENETWRLPGQRVVVRVGRGGRLAGMEREVWVARWLEGQGVPVVRPLDVDQPVEIRGRPVTFWEELPPHRHGTAEDVAVLLRRLHGLPAPASGLGALDPFAGIAARIDAATTLDPDDRDWLRGLHRKLAGEWRERPAGLPACAVHGDAWPGNFVRTEGGQRLVLDLERFSVGPPEWDLTSTAVRHRTTGAVTSAEYRGFCDAYGFDVTEWPGYGTLARIRELRMVTYAARHAGRDPAWASEARHRVACLRGHFGPRPWRWRGIL